MKSEDFSKFFKDNLNNIYRFIFVKVNSKDVAQDLTSETFLRTWRYVNDKNRDTKNVRALCYKIARNLVIDHYRAKGEAPVSLDVLPQEATADEFPDKNVEYRLALSSDVELVRNAMADIRQEHADVVQMHYLDSLSIKEIAEAMGVAEGTIRVWLHRGLEELRKKLSD